MNAIEDLLSNGSDEQKMEFIVNNVLAMCEATELCPHCVAETVLDILDNSEQESIH